MITQSSEPTYLDATRDAVDLVRELAEKTRCSELPTRLLISEIESLHPRSREERKRTELDAAHDVLLSFARRIVMAAWDDIHLANQRPDGNGNASATITIPFPETVRWARYAATKGNEQARELVNYIENLRDPDSTFSHFEPHHYTMALPG